MKVETLVVGPLATNCYFLVCERGRAGVFIDPGDEADLLVERFRKEGLEKIEILNTHGHGDHIAANRELAEELSAPVSIGRLDAEALTNPNVNLSVFLGTPISSVPAARLLDDGDVIEFGFERLEVLHTPGHTPGSVSFFSRKHGLLFCGDLVFFESVGRTDLPGGSFETLLQSITTKVFTLPEDTVIYPGHGPQTTVEHEQNSNPFV